MAAANTVRVTFLGDADGLARAARMAQGQMDKVSTSVGRATKIGSFLGSMAGGLATSALGKVQSFATGSVDAFARIEDATGAAGVQFGDQLPKITAFAENAAKSFGMSKGAAIDAANTFGTLGKSAGLSGENLSTFATDLTGLAGDLASFKGTSTEQAIGAVGAALRGETEPIRAYGVMLDQAAIEAEALAMGLVKPVKNMDEVAAAQTRAQLALKTYNAAVAEHGKDSDQAARAELAMGTATRALDKAIGGKVPKLTAANKVLASQSLITKGTTDAQGDFARTSDSTANTQKRLAAETENAQAQLGQKLAPAITAARNVALKLVTGLTGVFDALGKMVGFVSRNRGAFTALAAVIGAVLLPMVIRLGIQYTVTAAKAVASAARQAAAWLVAQAGAYKALAAHLRTFAAIVAGWIRAGATAMAQAARSVAAWVMVQVQAVKSMAAHVRAFAVMVAGWVRAGAMAMKQAARMAAAWLISIGPIAIAIAAVVGAVVLVIKNWDKIKAATAKAWEFVRSLIGKAISGIVSILTNFTGPGLVIKHWDKIVAYIKAVPGKLASLVTDFVNMGKNMITGMVRGILDTAGQVIDAIKSSITDKLPGFVKKALGISSPSKVFRAIGKEIPNGMAKGIEDRQKKVAEALDKMVTKAKDRLAEIKSFAADIRSTFADFGSVTGIDTMVAGDDGEDREGGFAALLGGLRARAVGAAKFADAMARLRKAGLNEATLADLREAGPDTGLETAQHLLSGGAAGIGQVNALTRQIAASGAAFADREARARYGIGANETLQTLNNREIRLVLDPKGADSELLKLFRKMIRVEGGNVQKVLGSKQ